MTLALNMGELNYMCTFNIHEIFRVALNPVVDKSGRKKKSEMEATPTIIASLHISAHV